MEEARWAFEAERMESSSEEEWTEVKEEHLSDSEDREVIEPLPSSRYSSPVPAPTPPPSAQEFEGFDWSEEPVDDFNIYSSSEDEPTHLALSDNEPLARRSSHWLEEEHTVTEPSFLTADWDSFEFPTVNTSHLVDSHLQWGETAYEIPCYTFRNWSKWIMDMPQLDRPQWVMPEPLFTRVLPTKVAHPPSDNDHGLLYKQQVISNTYNCDWNYFADPTRDDLVLHSTTHIPLVPTGKPASLEMEYLFEVLFQESGQLLSVQLRDPEHGRLVRLDIRVSDRDISVDTMVNHRRMNHVRNDESCAPWEANYRYWDEE